MSLTVFQNIRLFVEMYKRKQSSLGGSTGSRRPAMSMTHSFPAKGGLKITAKHLTKFHINNLCKQDGEKGLNTL